jgi:hypothetical protein
MFEKDALAYLLPHLVRVEKFYKIPMSFEGATTHSMATFIITALSITSFSIMALSITIKNCDTKLKDTLDNATQFYYAEYPY